MRNHISYRSGNPALQSSTFKGHAADSKSTMTLDGTVNKVSISLLVLMVTAMYTFSNPSVHAVIAANFKNLFIILLSFPFLSSIIAY